MLPKLSMMMARGLAPFPTALDWYLRQAKDYVDWRNIGGTICRTDFGAMMNCRLNDTIQRKVAYFGVWEPNISAYFKRALRAGDVIADVGANIGYYSLLGSYLVGSTGKVIAVEASPEIFDLLQKNLALNGKWAGNVRSVNCAAAYEVGKMPVFSGPPENIGASSTIPVEGNVLTGTVSAKPLHQIMTDEEMARCRIIKIDIEGAELPVVRSILDNIDLYKPDCEIVVEVSSENSSLLDGFARAGFNAYLLQNEYKDAIYIERASVPPERYTGKIDRRSDLIFSRKDADFL